MKAYKVFNSDWKCNGFQYEVGKTYRFEDKKGNLLTPEMCKSGFHACLKANNCFAYYSFDSANKIAEVELSGIILGEDEDKQCSNIIEIIKEVSWTEMLVLANTGNGCSGHSNSGNWNSGHWNSGNWNSGDRNSGDWNSGDWNSGDWNSGDRNSGDLNSGDRNSGHSNSGNWNSGDSNSGDLNSGDWNSGDRNSGFFNTTTPDTINIFNKITSRCKWENAIKPSFFFFSLTAWISFSSMTDDEKIKNPNAYVCDGYLKVYGYKEAWAISFEKATSEDIKCLKNLPNFNAKIFEEITGIKIN